MLTASSESTCTRFVTGALPAHLFKEEAAPPLPSCSITHYENGGGPDVRVTPPPQEKPVRNGTRTDEARPSVESLLDELESTVPSPR